MDSKEKKSFDLKTHIRNKKTGAIEQVRPYTLKISNGQMIYIRDGVQYHPDGEQVDRNQTPTVQKSVEEIKKEMIQKGLKFDETVKKLEVERMALQEELKVLRAKNKQPEPGSKPAVKPVEVDSVNAEKPKDPVAKAGKSETVDAKF